MALKSIKEGHVLVYADAGCKLNFRAEKWFREYLNLLQQQSSSSYNVLGFQLRNRTEYKYTAEHAFRALGVDASDRSIRDSGQLIGTVLILQKGPHLRKWLHTVNEILERDPWLFTFTDKYIEETKRLHPEFIEHRHDQSILSVSRKIIGSVVIPDETYPLGHPNYPFWASRSRTGW
jgi:hypothetical protein